MGEAGGAVEKRTCAWEKCGKEFKPHSDSQIWCKPQCRMGRRNELRRAAYVPPAQRSCEGCGRRFKPGINVPSQRFCTQLCHYETALRLEREETASRLQSVESKVCEWHKCGVTFVPLKKSTYGPIPKYCSSKCRSAAKKSRASPEATARAVAKRRTPEFRAANRAYLAKWRKTEGGKASRARYLKTEGAKKSREKYLASERVKENKRRLGRKYCKSPRGKERHRKYQKSENYKAYRKKYQKTEQSKKYHREYAKTPKSKERAKAYRAGSEKFKDRTRKMRQSEKYKKYQREQQRRIRKEKFILQLLTAATTIKESLHDDRNAEAHTDS